MKINVMIKLLPHKYKKVGWILLIPATILWIYLIYKGYDGLDIDVTVFAIISEFGLSEGQYFDLIQVDITNTLAGIFFIAGALLVIFSKERNEDEFIASLRQSSILWAVLVNYILLFLAFVFIYGFAFLTVMMYNMFTILIIYIIRFHYILYRNSQKLSDEEYD